MTWATGGQASREGFYAMLLDVAAQSSITVGIYTGGAMYGCLAQSKAQLHGRVNETGNSVFKVGVKMALPQPMPFYQTSHVVFLLRLPCPFCHRTPVDGEAESRRKPLATMDRTGHVVGFDSPNSFAKSDQAATAVWGRCWCNRFFAVQPANRIDFDAESTPRHSKHRGWGSEPCTKSQPCRRTGSQRSGFFGQS